MPAYFAQPSWWGGPWWDGYPYATELVLADRDVDYCTRLLADRDRVALRDAPAAATAALNAARSGGYRPRCAASCDPVLELRSGRWTIVYYGSACAGLVSDLYQGIPVVFDSTSPLAAAETPAPSSSNTGMYLVGAGLFAALVYAVV